MSTWSTLESVRSSVLNSNLGAITYVAVVLAGILAAAAMLKVADDYVEGHGMKAWDILRPLVLLLLVCEFNSMVLAPLNGMVNIFTKSLSKTVSVSTDEYIAQWSACIARVGATTMNDIDEDYNTAMEELTQDRSAIGKFFCKVWLSMKKAVMQLLNVTSISIGTLIGGILFLMMKMVLFGQQVICYVVLTIVGLIGPIVFALSILPGFSSGIRSWIARYIQIAMWIPIGYLIMKINLEIGKAFSSMAIADGAGLSLDWFMIILQAVALSLIASVPKLAGMVIESTGMNDAHASVSQPLRSVFKSLIRF